MKMHRFSGLLTLGSIILSTGCSQQTISDNEIYVNPVPVPSVIATPVDLIPSLNLGQSDDTEFMTKEIANTRLIPLETTDDCLIGNITDLRLVGDTLVVVDGYKSKQVYLFNRDGKFLSKIGSVGDGPGEYGQITQATANSDGIEIFDMQSNRFIAYDYDGNIRETIGFNETSPIGVLRLNDSVFLAPYASYFEQFPFAIQWLEGDSIVDTAFPYSINRHEIAPSLFRLNENEIGLHIPYNDTIYSITDRQITPLYTLGLITEEESRNWLLTSAKMSNDERIEYVMNNKNAPVEFETVYPTEDYFVITHQKGTNVYISIVDRKTLESRNYIIGSAKAKRQYILPHFITVSGNSMLGSFEDTYFINLSKKTREEIEKHFSEHDQEILKNYDYENNNPIVWLMELK